MPYDRKSELWPKNGESFFRDGQFEPMLQNGPHCVSTCLAVLTGKSPENFQTIINSQDPFSWSEVLQPFGKKLAYCPTDVRRLKHYLKELLDLDDLFLLCYYSLGANPLAEPDEEGWICSSHVVILHRNQIIDTKHGEMVSAWEHEGMEAYTKRIFRVVPIEHARGL